LISGLGFTIFRERRQGRLLVLVLLPLLTALRHPNDGPLVLAVTCLSGLIAWIYQKLPDDLDLPDRGGTFGVSHHVSFFSGRSGAGGPGSAPRPHPVWPQGRYPRAAAAWGYPVPRGYVLPGGG
jgi:hypothetical protein